MNQHAKTFLVAWAWFLLLACAAVAAIAAVIGLMVFLCKVLGGFWGVVVIIVLVISAIGAGTSTSYHMQEAAIKAEMERRKQARR